MDGAGKRPENLFIDAQARALILAWLRPEYPGGAGVTIKKEAGDDEILKNTVDFVSFSYYASMLCLSRNECAKHSAANIVNPCVTRIFR